jgi:hypothetical protein
MKPSNFRRRILAAGTVGAAALIGVMGVGITTASAAVPADPGTGYPSFNNGVINQIRGTGSDTTVFMMQKISDLYTGAGLYGCTLNTAANQGLFNDAFVSTGTNLSYFCQGTWSAFSVITANGSPTITLTAGGNFPLGINGDPIQDIGGPASPTDIPAGTTILSGAGTATLTLSANATADNPTGVTLQYSTGATANTGTTDTADNWSRTEVAQGVDNVGSGAGQEQLCKTAPTPLPVDFARSSKPVGSTTSLNGCNTANLQAIGYAKDAVPPVDFRINPSAMVTSGGNPVAATHAPWNTVNGGVVGPLAKGWEPGDSVSASTFSGAQLNNISNNDNSGGATSTAYRLWCSATVVQPATTTSRIYDWGQLTNTAPTSGGNNLAVPNASLAGQAAGTDIPVPNAASLPASVVGKTVTDLSNPGNIPASTTVTAIDSTGIQLSNAVTATSTDNLRIHLTAALAADSGFPIGAPISIAGVNTGSGTESTWASFAESGVSSGGCSSNANTNANASGVANSRQLLENNASQIGDNALALDYPTDLAAQADEIASTLYYLSNGVANSTPYSAAVCFPDVVTPQGCDGSSTVYSSFPLKANNQGLGSQGILDNVYPTSRTLFNIVNTTNLRGSTAGFINWICDSQSAITKQKDNSTGVNFDNELTNIIQSFGFQRLTDTAAAPADGNTPADNVTNGGINTSCASGTTGTGAGNGSPAVIAAWVTSPST